jgi:hypothetical protein
MRLFRRRGPFDFVRNPPQSVGELAKDLGLEVAVIWGGAPALAHLPSPPRHPDAGPLSDTVDDVMLSFAWDMYHQSPIGSPELLAAEALEDYSVFFLAGHQECAAALEERYGTPQPTLRDYSVRYGSFFLSDPRPEGRFGLGWYREEPDWNKSPADLAAALAEVRERGSASIDPPGSALEVARLLGDPDPVAQSHDVHQSTWSFRVGDVEAWLQYGASGETIDAGPAGPTVRRRLGENDRVRRLSLTARGDE